MHVQRKVCIVDAGAPMLPRCMSSSGSPEGTAAVAGLHPITTPPAFHSWLSWGHLLRRHINSPQPLASGRLEAADPDRVHSSHSPPCGLSSCSQSLCQGRLGVLVPILGHNGYFWPTPHLHYRKLESWSLKPRLKDALCTTVAANMLSPGIFGLGGTARACGPLRQRRNCGSLALSADRMLQKSGTVYANDLTGSEDLQDCMLPLIWAEPKQALTPRQTLR